MSVESYIRSTTMILKESGVKTDRRITHQLNEVKQREAKKNEEKRDIIRHLEVVCSIPYNQTTASPEIAKVQMLKLSFP